MKKSELLELLDELERISYYSNHANFKLISMLLKNYDRDAKELEVLTKEIARQIIDVFIDCYKANDLINWLYKRNWNPFYNIHNSKIVKYSELRGDELLKILKNGDYLYNDEEEGILILSW